MPLQVVRNDITKIKADAIVNTANQDACVGEGVDFAVYTAAGYENLLRERKKIGEIKPGTCAPTSGFALDCKYILHTVGTFWEGGTHGEEEILRNCYRSSLKLAKNLCCHTVAIPLMSAGNFGYPKELALHIAQEEIEKFLEQYNLQVLLVIYDKKSLMISQKQFAEIQEFIDNHYVEKKKEEQRNEYLQGNDSNYVLPKLTIEELFKKLDETFSQKVLRIMQEKNLKPADVYTAANLDRKMFSKLNRNINFHPNKLTAISLAIGLKLNLKETQQLLYSAGYSLSYSDKFDLLIMYCLENKIYKYYRINWLLADNGFEGIGQR